MLVTKHSTSKMMFDVDFFHQLMDKDIHPVLALVLVRADRKVRNNENRTLIIISLRMEGHLP
ncbi:hypothetical protein VIBC2010_11281 [Vibrio caribbeanicus ATCC BAA-2122]|uniref:Uncharacterized protein n=1 Tax=Vibrio caribbeanicus ATCC BAA-2122 TaxID=796620 RepID=E3BF24_9VIBR|nr:hypothetical protein VIBC2010_11281 [Vibrio caribbeanicus ATCC BAA-2122]